MVVKTVEGSLAVAETIRECEPDVVACYPITPSTHIAEDLNRMYADGGIKKYIAVEAEFSAISALIGASAAGGRAVSTTSSQGLLLMHEALFAAAGMRLPMVLVVANRAVSAPLNIWGDQQDSMSQRDSGWIQLYCETNQETADSIPIAFKVSEETRLPVMVCMDGFYLTHSVEQIDVPEKKLVDKFLPKYNPEIKLDTENPLSFGVYAMPSDYQSFREDLELDLQKAKQSITRAQSEWNNLTGRNYGMIEQYMVKDAENVFVAMGSVCGNAKEAIDQLRANGEKVGLLRVRAFRPFPFGEVAGALNGKKNVAVFEKAVSLGGAPPLFGEVLCALNDLTRKPTVSSFIGGLGGKDVTVNDLAKIMVKIKDGEKRFEWV